jgi:hypothetical protein
VERVAKFDTAEVVVALAPDGVIVVMSEEKSMETETELVEIVYTDDEITESTKPFFTAMALIVVMLDTAIGVMYWLEVAVGTAPLVV